MSSIEVVLEPSEGASIRSPSREQIRSVLERIGAGLDHCILELGAETDYLQVAGARNRLLIQYRDATGMHESVRSDLDAATLERVFVDAMGGATGWKTEFTFRPMDAPGGVGDPPRAGSSSPPRSPEPDLLDAAKRAAKAGVERFVKRGLRGLFGGKS